MENLIVQFDKSLVVPEQDYEVFKKENYSIDDGTFHLFVEENNSLLILDSNKKPAFCINFQEVVLEKKKCFEINSLKYRLKSPMDPKKDFDKAQNEVVEIVKEVFALLDNILFKRTKVKNENDGSIKYNYCIYDKNNHKFDKLVTFQNRVSYLQILPQLAYLFGIVD